MRPSCILGFRVADSLCRSPINRIALRYYMDYFDFTGLRLDNAFRRLCGKLFLKAETQQVDRILEQFARRYWECNPTSILGSASRHPSFNIG